jgi:hypothetical protein
MRRLIATITGTITNVVGNRTSGDGVTGLATPWLPVLRLARTLLVRLTGGVPAGWQALEMRHMQPAVAATSPARMLKHYCLSTLRPRPRCRRVKPGTGASAGRF